MDTLSQVYKPYEWWVNAYPSVLEIVQISNEGQKRYTFIKYVRIVDYIRILAKHRQQYAANISKKFEKTTPYHFFYKKKAIIPF